MRNLSRGGIVGLIGLAGGTGVVLAEMSGFASRKE